MTNSKYAKPKDSCPKCGKRGHKLSWFCLIPGDYYYCESCRYAYFLPEEATR